MTLEPEPFGVCPCCGTGIPPGQVLIEYETDDGRAAFAECPHCHTVVRPE